MAGYVEITKANFTEEVLKVDKPVLVDFWAEWCMPCKLIVPVLDDLNRELNDKLKIVKVDVDNNPEISMNYSVRSIPTLMLFKNGEVVEQLIGAVPKKTILDRIKPFI